MREYKHTGFTIVELLIVIVVIGILAALVLNSFAGVQERARQAKIQSDLAAIDKAIRAARTNAGTSMFGVTGNSVTPAPCVAKASGTDLAALPKTDACWVNYLDALDKISIASGNNIRDIVDPWGRPYFIDANEDENNNGGCSKDSLAAYTYPFVTGWTGTNWKAVPNSVASCI